MFPVKGLFAALPCPDKQACRRPVCLFSHDQNANETQLVHIPVDAPKETPASSSTLVQPRTRSSVPNKRPLTSSLAASSSSTNVSTVAAEPPRKLQRTGPTKKPVAVPTATHTSVSRSVDRSVVRVSILTHTFQTGVPIIRVPAAQSQVAIPVRQVCPPTSMTMTSSNLLTRRRCFSSSFNTIAFSMRTS